MSEEPPAPPQPDGQQEKEELYMLVANTQPGDVLALEGIPQDASELPKLSPPVLHQEPSPGEPPLTEQQRNDNLTLETAYYRGVSAASRAVDQINAKANEVKLHHEATHDELTGLLNRRGLYEAVDKMGNGGFKKVLFADGTNIKAVNDLIDHDRGDEAIIGLADVLKDSIRDSDILARIGGDEFVIILNDVGEEDGQQVGTQEQFLAVENRIGGNAQEYLDKEENADLKSLGMHVAVGAAIWPNGQPFVKVQQRAEANMNRVKTEQHNMFGKHR